MVRKITTLAMFIMVCALFTQDASAQSDDWAKGMFGTWQCDAEKTAELMKSMDKGEGEIEMVKEMAGGLSMSFQDGGVMKMIMDMGGMKQENNATFEVTETDDEKKMVKIKVKMEETPDDEKSADITIIDENHISLVTTDESGMAMVFKRVAEKKEEADESKEGESKEGEGGE